jgi:hypothetical protein
MRFFELITILYQFASSTGSNTGIVTLAIAAVIMVWKGRCFYVSQG